MNVEHLTDPVLITRPGSLKQLADRLINEPIVAVDTESNSLYAYKEQVCLIQFSTPETDFLVDPLALKDLSPLGVVFASPNIEKVFHAAEYDLLCLRRDFEFDFDNLFDTMVAARVLGIEEIGLGSLLEAEFGVHLDKRFQRADWGQRPLPPHLLSYARLDTHFLIRLRDRMLAELHEKKLWSLAYEDFQRMRNVNGVLQELRTPDVWRISGAQELAPRQAAILNELCRYRDHVARTLNRPLFKVISDRTLLQIARDVPSTIRELSQVPGMSRGQIERHGSALLAATQKGLKAPPLLPERTPRPSEQFLERMDALRRWRKQTAQDMGVKSDVILPRDLMYQIAERSPRTKNELAEILSNVPWRLERFGGEILQTISGS